MKTRTGAIRRQAAKTQSVMSVLATILGGSASLGTTLASAKAKHHKAAKCKAGHKDRDGDGTDKRCPDDHDGATV